MKGTHTYAYSVCRKASIRYLPKPQIEMLFACPDFVSGTDAEADADAAAPTKPQSQERRFCFCGVKGSSATG